MLENFGIQEIDHIVVKANQSMQVGNKKYGKGEVVLYITDVELATLRENTYSVDKRGGKESHRILDWISYRGCEFNVVRGVVTKEELPLLFTTIELENEKITLNEREKVRVDSSGYATLSYLPLGDIYCYYNGEKLYGVMVEGKKLLVGRHLYDEEIIVDYSYNQDNSDIFLFSTKENTYYYYVEVHFYAKSDETGDEYKCAVIIPNAVIEGNVELKVNDKVSPVLSGLGIKSVRTTSSKEYVPYKIVMSNEVRNEFL